MKPKTLGQRLKALREFYGHSQSEMAANIGLKGHVGIYKIEQDLVSKPQAETIRNLVKAYGTTEEWLMHGKGEMLVNGRIDVRAVSQVEESNPWRDALIAELNDKAKKLEEKYNNLYTLFSNTVSALGKLNPDGGSHLSIVPNGTNG